MKKTAEEEQLFVAVRDKVVTEVTPEIIKSLQEQVRNVQTWFFDLDDNHAPSPAKQIARSAMGTSHFSSKYLHWGVASALKLAVKGKAAESEIWKEYVDLFLRDEKALADIQRLFTPENARRSLYPGVEEFCGLISDSQRFYVTRNITEVVGAYASALHFNGFFPEAYDKERTVEGYLRKHPEIQRYGVEGDSEEDAAMIEVLQFYKKDVVSFYSVDYPTFKEDRRFQYIVPKDKRELVQILRE